MGGDAVPQVRRFLSDAAERLMVHGVQKERIVVDPGIGFGKTVEQNFSLLARQHELLELGYPVLVGWSRKSSIGAALQGSALTAPAPSERILGSVAAALLAVERGALIVRVHDVIETAQALAIWQRVRTSSV
jgi:dihydropteroate synthase